MKGVVSWVLALACLALLPDGTGISIPSAFASTDDGSPSETEDALSLSRERKAPPSENIQNKIQGLENLGLEELQKVVKDLENLPRELKEWAGNAKDAEAKRLNKILDLKVFQSNVFFGGLAAFFLLLFAFFILKFIYNIARDLLVAVYEKILKLMGRDLTRVPERHFAPIMNDPRKKTGKTKPVSGNKRE